MPRVWRPAPPPEPAAASTSVAAASRLLVRRAPPRLLRRVPRAPLAALPSPSSYGAAAAVALGRQPLGHRARMGHTAAAAAAGPALGLTKPNAVEPPQVSFAAKDVEFSDWKGDILAIAVREKDLAKGSDSKFENAVLKKLDGQLGGLLSEASAEEDFTGKAGQSVVLRLAGQGFKRVGLIGLGQNAPSTTAACKGIGESVASVAKSAQASTAAIVFASVGGIQEDFKLTAAAAIASGTVLGLHEDSRYKSESKRVHLKQVDLIGFGSGPEVDQKLKYANDLSSGVIFGKELVNSPANVLTPAVLAEEASNIASTYSDVFTATILDVEKCKELKMGSYLGVAAASANPPHFIHLCYKSPGGNAKRKLAIVGKGLTFDSGGYNIKTGPVCSIELMKFDMGGSAAVFGAAKLRRRSRRRAAAAAAAMGGPIEIDWEDVMPTTTAASSPHGDDVEVRFVSTSSRSSVAPRPRPRLPREARTEEEAEIVRMRDDELRREMATAGRLRRPFEGILNDGGEGSRRRRALLEAEARRRGIGPASKDGDGRHSAARDVFSFDIEDQLGEDASRKFCGKSWPVSSTKENYGQLGIETWRSSRQIGQRKPISVDKMYSSKPCSSTLSGHKLRVHAIDPDEKADDEKSQPSRRCTLRNSTKRRKEKHQLCLHDFQMVGTLISDKASIPIEVQDVVLLDDEDVQPEDQVDCGMHDRWNETMIYYPTRDDPEAVELSSSDIKCLDPGVYLSSPVINFYIQYIKRTKLYDDDCREKFYIFNTYFYSKLEEALLGKGEFVKLRRWWKGVNIYHTSYIILPIHGMAHWSLIIICIPSKESNSGPIIIHLDSLALHSSAKIFDIIGRYLEAEWCHVRKNPPPDISISETIWEDLPSNIQKEKVQVPQQRNEYDCGIFMLYYIERFIREAPARFTRDNLGMFSRSWFQPEDASDLRQRIRELLMEEFESARLDEALSEADTSDRSDNEEDATKSGAAGAAAAAASPDSSETIVEGGDTGISNEDEGVMASKEASSSICRSADKLTGCVISEEATLSDGMMKDEEDTTKADPVGSQNEHEVAVLSPGAWKNSEENTHKQRAPDICCDSSDSETDDVKIIEAPYEELTSKTVASFDMKASCGRLSHLFHFQDDGKI